MNKDRPFDKRAFASKQPTLAIVIPDRDLYGMERDGKQIRVFTKGEEYKLTRKLNEWDICLVDNKGVEVQIADWAQHFTYKETGLPLSTYYTKMTPYEIKDVERAISQFEKIKKDSEEKRARAEAELIKEARKPSDRFYFDRLKHTIWTETEHIAGADKEISKYKAKLINAGVNC